MTHKFYSNYHLALQRKVAPRLSGVCGHGPGHSACGVPDWQTVRLQEPEREAEWSPCHTQERPDLWSGPCTWVMALVLHVVCFYRGHRSR